MFCFMRYYNVIFAIAAALFPTVVDNTTLKWYNYGTVGTL